jgi:hypothetical protein
MERVGVDEGVGYEPNQRGGVGDFPGKLAVFVPVSSNGMTGGALRQRQEGEGEVTNSARKELGRGPSSVAGRILPPRPFYFFLISFSFLFYFLLIFSLKIFAIFLI